MKKIFRYIIKNPIECLKLIAIPVSLAVLVQAIIFFMWAAEAAGFKM